MKEKATVAAVFCLVAAAFATQKNGEVWRDTSGHVVNAHGGGVLAHGGRYYLYGEHKIYGKAGSKAHVGVHMYSSGDLSEWKDEGVVLAVEEATGHDIEDGCILERPKILFCERTGKFAMFFHLELKGMRYSSARTGIAVADRPTGPYRFLRSLRPNDGQMSRDMTLFKDDDGKAYQFYTSEDNATLHVAELTEDYLDYTGRWWRMAEKDFTEAPAVCKKDGWYYLVGSGCTGWRPNAARYYRARAIAGSWERVGNPCSGVNPANGLGPELTWGGQSNYIFKVPDGSHFAMFDIWRPDNQIDSRLVMLPIVFENGNEMRIEWAERSEGIARRAEQAVQRVTDVPIEYCEATLPVSGGEVTYGWKGVSHKEYFSAPAGWRLVKRETAK